MMGWNNFVALGGVERVVVVVDRYGTLGVGDKERVRTRQSLRSRALMDGVEKESRRCRGISVELG